MAKRKQWQPVAVKSILTKVGQERFEQTLAEVGEILYSRLCQQVRSKSESPEPAKELEENQFKKAASI